MKESSNGSRADARLTADEFEDFLRSVGPKDHDCSFCGSKNWKIPMYNDRLAFHVAPIVGIHPDGQRILIISCAKCGYLKQFLASEVEDRVRGGDSGVV